jgi:hypothetical protein
MCVASARPTTSQPIARRCGEPNAFFARALDSAMQPRDAPSSTPCSPQRRLDRASTDSAPHEDEGPSLTLTAQRQCVYCIRVQCSRAYGHQVARHVVDSERRAMCRPAHVRPVRVISAL